MTKLDETMSARAESRARLLELKQQQTSKSQQRHRLSSELVDIAGAITREKAKLVELTTEAGKLLHSDLAGVVGREPVRGEPELSADAGSEG